MMLRLLIAVVLLAMPLAAKGASVGGYPLKAAPVGADRLDIRDSQDGNKTKSVELLFFAPAHNPIFTGTITVPGFTGTTYTGTDLLAAIQAALTELDGAADVNASPYMLTLLEAEDAAAARTELEIGNVDNTADIDKPVSTAMQAALDNKQNAATISTSQPSGGVDGDVWYVVQ